MSFKNWYGTLLPFEAKALTREEIFQAGAASERIITLQDDDSLRFIKRVLEGDAFTAQDKVECLRLIHAIRTRIRGGYTE